LELPVWLSANATKVYRHGENNGWHVDVDVQGEKKTLKPRHVVFALGWGAGEPSIPEYPGTVRLLPISASLFSPSALQEEFGGEFIHSAAHKTAQAHVGKKVVVIGASTSGHDVSADLAKHSVGENPPLSMICPS
jgi:cation diffusion facilitator CzcD-associated flavoprotein CzcO